MATLPGAWHYWVGAGTGRPGVSILWLGEAESWICNFYLMQLSEQIRPWDTLTCCWDVKQPTNELPLSGLTSLPQAIEAVPVTWQSDRPRNTGVKADLMCTLIRCLGFMGTSIFFISSLLSWMFEHDCLDTCHFGCLICMSFVVLCVHLFSAIEHVSHGKALSKYAHYYILLLLLLLLLSWKSLTVCHRPRTACTASVWGQDCYSC